jgi:hypothetical protein
MEDEEGRFFLVAKKSDFSSGCYTLGSFGIFS